MKTIFDYPVATDTGVIGSRIDRIDPDIFRNQNEPAIDEEDEVDENGVDEELYDEPLDEDGDPTGEHDHHQDDNYALGGHVTRSGS